MSQQVSTNFEASFDSLVKHAYASAGVLNGSCREKSGVVGSTHRFPKMGKGLAQKRIPQTDVVPMNVSHSNATATLTDWVAPEYSDIFDLEKISFDEKQELAKIVAGAMGRRKDQLKLDAMASGANATQVGVNIGGTNTGLNVDKLRRASRLMNAAGVPMDGKRHIAIAAIGLEQLLGETTATSADFNSVKALVSGDIDTFMGFKFHIIEDRDEGGLDLTSNTRTNFAWHEDALGIATGLNMQTKIDWVPEKTSWLINGMYSAGSVVIDSDGVYDVLTYEA